MDAEEFERALELYMETGDGTEVAEDESDALTVRVMAGFAAVEQYYLELQRSAIVRISAYHSINEFLELEWEGWVLRSPAADGFHVHPAVPDAAAEAPVNADGQFEKQSFLATVRRIASEYYPDIPPRPINPASADPNPSVL